MLATAQQHIFPAYLTQKMTEPITIVGISGPHSNSIAIRPCHIEMLVAEAVTTRFSPDAPPPLHTTTRVCSIQSSATE